MSIETIDHNRVSVWQRAVLLGIIGVFLATGVSRLNDCDLFNPDSPRYVIYSQALVDLGDYRAIDLPGAPLYTWRPPGLSMLLAPAMALRPYDVIAAKVVVLLTGAFLLWIAFELALLHSSAWTSLIVTGVIASGPSFLVLSTEVLTEVPYAVGVLLVLFLLSRSTFQKMDDTSSQRRWSRWTTLGLAMAALAFTPWLRTAGVALVAAVGIWSAVSRSRWQWLSTVAVAAIGLGILAWRNKQAAGENYVGSLWGRFREQGVGPTITSGLETIGQYVLALPALLLPGLTRERPWYSPLTLDASPTMGLAIAVTACVAATIVSIALLGMCQRRAHGGSLALLYVVIYGACLVVWPWRHERFLWPLIPVLMIYVPTGWNAMASNIPLIGTGLSQFGMMTMLALCGWQGVSCEQLVRVNREFVQSPEKFHADRIPGFYFSNWRRAGMWLNAHTPPTARVLTWHAAVAGTSHRFQKRVQFEVLTIEKLRQQIEGFSARYLVIPAGQFGDGFSWQILGADPSRQVRLVYCEDDVAILEINPNRTGEVSKDAYPHWLNQQLQLTKDASDRNPTRTDLTIRYASLLREAGKTDEAIHVFRILQKQGVKTARVYSELGWLLFENHEFAEAATLLDAARVLPNAESIAPMLAEGAVRARARLEEKDNDKDARPLSSQLNQVKILMSGLKFAQAEVAINQILVRFPDDPEALFVRGKLHHRLGEDAAAADCYERALQRGCGEARPWLRLIRFHEAMSGEGTSTISISDQREEVKPTNPDDHVKLARQFQECGWTGKALRVLELADQRFSDQTCIQRPLADLYRSFAMPESAMSLYERLLARDPNDDAAKKGLQLVQSELIQPAMYPLTKASESEIFTKRSGINLSRR